LDDNSFIEKIAKTVEPLSNRTATAYNISSNIVNKLRDNTDKAIHILEAVDGAADTVINIVSNIDEKITGVSEIIDNNKLLKLAVNSALPLLIGQDKTERLIKDFSNARGLPMPSHSTNLLPAASEYSQLEED
jgi:hypothetical protein